MSVKAIETRYKGYRFRSRLEARWAVFLDALGVAWRYEVEGLRLTGGGRCYLPDFYLPKPKLWLEIKPQDTGLRNDGAPTTPQDVDDAAKHYACALETDVPLLVAVGLGPNSPAWLGGADGIWGRVYLPGRRSRYSSWALHACADYFGPIVGTLKTVARCRFCSAPASAFNLFIDTALSQAKSARFEHGETPQPRIVPNDLRMQFNPDEYAIQCDWRGEP
jgi:hypothetical protein